MKLIINLFVCLCAATVVCGETTGKDPHAHILQDCLLLDLRTGDLLCNDEALSLEELGNVLESSYSVSLYAESEEAPTVSAAPLLSVLEMMESAGLEPERVRMNLYLPTLMKRNQYHLIQVTRAGEIGLNGSDTTIAELAGKDFPRAPFVIQPERGAAMIDYRSMLALLRGIGPDAELAGLAFASSDKVEVSAQISVVGQDGDRDVLTAPKVTAMPGKTALIRVVQNASGRKDYSNGIDPYFQEDLASLGVRFSVKPQIISEHLRVSGAVILTKLEDREGIFMDGAVPIASYSCKKTVVPFSVVFPPGTDAIDFPVADVAGKETMCRLTAEIVDDRGMTRAQREQARRASGKHVPVEHTTVIVTGVQAE